MIVWFISSIPPFYTWSHANIKPISVAVSYSLGNSPLQALHSPFLENAKVQLYVKRDDLLHPDFGGNKWRKLKYNLLHAKQHNYHTLLTFGGAWSNHLYATAAAARHFGFNSIAIIRGEQHTPLNPTLAFAEKCGMSLHYVSRTDYRQKHEAAFQQKLKQQFGEVYILPEGGSNVLALKGCEEIVTEINDVIELPFDTICCASGTGATLAGLVKAIQPGQTAIGFSALKGGAFLEAEVDIFLQNKKQTENSSTKNWRIEADFHFGGYAKVNDELIQFMRQFNTDYGFPLDAVYTGKMFYGLFKRIADKTIKPGSRIVALHSGGLQGNKGFNL